MIENGGRKEFGASAELTVRKGDLLRLTVNAHKKSHVCDTTQVALTVTESGDRSRVWDLARDVVDRIHDSNPLADSHGNASVWHFCASGATAPKEPTIPLDSALAQWRNAVMDGKPAKEVDRAATTVQESLLRTGNHKDSDAAVKAAVCDWQGAFRWFPQIESSTDLEQTAPSILEFQIPNQLAKGAEFVATVTLHPEKGKEGSAQVKASLTKPQAPLPLSLGNLKEKGGKKQWTDGVAPVVSDFPIIVSEDSKARKRIEADIESFRQLFPAALCYSKIVPVDEVVTLTLFHREDDHLRRLMLDRDETVELDRLWEELQFISREPLKLVDVFDQLYQFATQDADPSVFEPLRKPIRQRAERFRGKLVAAEPQHLDAVEHFAARAWRKPLSRADKSDLRTLYQQLRAQELEHEAAIRLTLARVLVAPEFLYKTEQPTAGEKATPVSRTELATRLSYFLWSSLPDEELFSASLTDEESLVKQTHRMLRDPRTRRLAIQFACQWLHVRDFDKNNDKNEKLYPEFAALRNSMYEETVRFFEDMIRNNGSILDLLDADHTFLNESLATHYGIEDVSGTDWKRVNGIQAKGRGGVLGMASFLASQSGASRTSPILRGNWVYETLLGERLPRPPANVPQLPDEVPKNLTARKLIEHHSGVPACAKCHSRIDPYGFALEQFDAIGRVRPKVIDTKTKLADGKTIEALDGLRDYLVNDRRDDFVQQFCRKLLGYALGREVQLSDEPLIEKMMDDLAKSDYRFSVAVEAVILSDQFQKIRGKLAANE